MNNDRVQISRYGTYHLYRDNKPIEFYKIFEGMPKNPKPELFEKEYPLYRKEGRKLVGVGHARLRDFMLMPMGENPVFRSLNKHQGASWKRFCDRVYKRLEKRPFQSAIS